MSGGQGRGRHRLVPSRTTIERRIKRMLRGVFEEFEDSAVEAAMGSGSFDYERFRQELRRALMTVMGKVTVDRVLRIAAEVGVAFDPANISTRASAWARQYTNDLVNQLMGTTQNVIGDAVAQYIETPDMTIRDLKDFLEPAFGEPRAERIAVTETTRAYSRATMQYRNQLEEEQGFVMAGVWQTAADDRVCPICAPLDGMPDVDWPESIKEAGGPPAHVNCRCSVALSALPISDLRAEHRERQAYLREAGDFTWPGAEPGGQ